MTLNLKQCKNDIPLDADTAIPVGLTLTELITNSIKYSNNSNGKLDIGIDIKNNIRSITYFDNGIQKVNDDLLLKKHDSLGIKVITSLIKQIRGEIVQTPQENGFMVSIKF